MSSSVSSTASTNFDVEAFKCPQRPGAEKDSNTTTSERRKRFSIRLPRPGFKFAFKLDAKVIYDAILGLSDGLTVPFALTAGLASVGSTRIVIMGGLAELVAGCISMGLGGFVGSKSESETYDATLRDCRLLIQETPFEARNMIVKHFEDYGLSEKDIVSIVNGLMASTSDLERFLLTHHYEISKPDASRRYVSAVTLGLSYFLGGFIALIPYLCVKRTQVYTALYISIGVMAFVMFVFGYIKTAVVRGWRGKDNIVASFKGAFEMLIIGALAVGAAVGLVKAIESGGSY